MNQNDIHDYNKNSFGTRYQNFVINIVEKDRGQCILNGFASVAGRAVGILKPIPRIFDIFKHTVLAASHLVGGLTLKPLHLIVWTCIGREANPTFHFSYTFTHLSFVIQFLADGIFSPFSNLLDPRTLKADNREFERASATLKNLTENRDRILNPCKVHLAEQNGLQENTSLPLENPLHQLGDVNQRFKLIENEQEFIILDFVKIRDRLIKADANFVKLGDDLEAFNKRLGNVIEPEESEIKSANVCDSQQSHTLGNQNNFLQHETFESTQQTSSSNSPPPSFPPPPSAPPPPLPPPRPPLTRGANSNPTQGKTIKTSSRLAEQSETTQKTRPSINKKLLEDIISRGGRTQPSENIVNETVNDTFNEFNIDGMPTDENDDKPEAVCLAMEELLIAIQSHRRAQTAESSDTPVPCSTIKDECKAILEEVKLGDYLHDLHYKGAERDLFNGFLNYYYTQYYVKNDLSIRAYVWPKTEIPTDDNGEITDITVGVGVTIKKKLQRIKDACDGLLDGNVYKYPDVLGSVVDLRRSVNVSQEDIIKNDARKFLCMCRSIACIRNYLIGFKSAAGNGEEHMRELYESRAAEAARSDAAAQEKIEILKTAAKDFIDFLQTSIVTKAAYKLTFLDKGYSLESQEEHKIESYVRTLYQSPAWKETNEDLTKELEKLKAALDS